MLGRVAVVAVALAFLFQQYTAQEANEENEGGEDAAAYPYRDANDMLSGYGSCPECDFCIHRNGTVKCFFVIHNVNWVEARDQCANYSAELATVRSHLETRFLNRTKSILGIGQWTNAWIGLRWKFNISTWLWVDDVPIQSIEEYNAFAPGEPGQTWDSCVEFIARDMYENYLGYYTGHWKVQNCLLRRDAICQYYRTLA